VVSTTISLGLPSVARVTAFGVSPGEIGSDSSSHLSADDRLLITFFLIWIAIAALCLILRVLLRGGTKGLPFLVGLIVAVVLAIVLLNSDDSSNGPSSGLSDQTPVACQARGHSIVINWSNRCSFTASGGTSWNLENPVPSEAFFANHMAPAPPRGIEFDLDVTRCTTSNCATTATFPDLVVDLGSFLSHLTPPPTSSSSRGPTIGHVATFVDPTAGAHTWILSVETLRSPHATGATHKPKGGSGLWSLLVKVSSVIAAVLLLVITGLLVLRSFRRDRRPRHDTEERDAVAEPTVAQVLIEAHLALEDATDARSAILLCWRSVERLLAAEGGEQLPSETADELFGRLLARGVTSKADLVTLHDLFLSARFSTRSVPEADRDTARRCLAAIRETWLVPESVTTSALS
jgi:membrane protein implicated in regulation of membrane protease activity